MRWSWTVAACELLLGLAALLWLGQADPGPNIERDRPQRPSDVAGSPVSARFDNPEIDETSGLVASRRHEGVFWAHNDSGDRTRIWAVTADGRCLSPAAGLPMPGPEWLDAEDIALTPEGLLAVADTGNNRNERRDLAVHLYTEPSPDGATAATHVRSLRFHYPEQTEFPPTRGRNFDCEAVFCGPGAIYLLTKHRSDYDTCLYALDPALADVDQPARRLGCRTIGEQVTAADLSPDGRRLAVLTYFAVWVFEPEDLAKTGLVGPSWSLGIRARQAEALAWDGPDALLVANEQEELYRFPMAAVLAHPVR